MKCNSKNGFPIFLLFIFLLTFLSTSYAKENDGYILKVLPFDSQNVSQSIVEKVSEKLSEEIRSVAESSEYRKSGNDLYTVYPMSEYDKLIEQMKKQDSFGSVPLINRIIIGTIDTDGASFTLLVRIVDVESQKEIKKTRYQCTGSIEVLLKNLNIVAENLLYGENRKM